MGCCGSELCEAPPSGENRSLDDIDPALIPVTGVPIILADESELVNLEHGVVLGEIDRDTFFGLSLGLVRKGPGHFHVYPLSKAEDSFQVFGCDGEVWVVVSRSA